MKGANKRQTAQYRHLCYPLFLCLTLYLALTGVALAKGPAVQNQSNVSTDGTA